jgi:hypothetical protein
MWSHHAILPIEFDSEDCVCYLEGMLCYTIDWRNVNTGETVYMLSRLSYISGSAFKPLSMLRKRHVLAQWLSGEKGQEHQEVGTRYRL